MSMTNLALPLPQSVEFARTCAQLNLPLRTCTRESQRGMRLSWQIQSRRLRMFGRVDLVSRGPVAAHPHDLRDWLRHWHRWHDGRPLVLNADGLGADHLQAAGFWPLLTPSTIGLLRLGPPAEMRQRLRQKWRNRLNRAQTGPLSIHFSPLTHPHWLLKAEAQQARAKGYRGLPPHFAAAFAAANPNQAHVFEARHDGTPVAGALVLRHGHMATWQIGFSSQAGRQHHAMNLLLWEMMVWLHERQIQWLDLGVLNTDDAAGLAHFKLGTGALAHRLDGTWLHHGALAPIAKRLPRRFLH